CVIKIKIPVLGNMNVSVPSFGRVFFIWKLVSGSDFSFCIIASYAYLPIDVWQTEYGDGVICVYW
ncbi:hypothetical protein OFO11_33995, partial [Escherichia coli]